MIVYFRLNSNKIYQVYKSNLHVLHVLKTTSGTLFSLHTKIEKLQQNRSLQKRYKFCIYQLRIDRSSMLRLGCLTDSIV